MSWIYYLLEANLYLAIFYALYYVLLKRETFHQANRAFLLSASLLAFVIPLVQVDFLKPVEPAQVNFAAGYTFQPVYTSTQFVEHIHPDDGTRALLVL